MDGAIRMGDIYNGETYDARKENAWTKPRYNIINWDKTAITPKKVDNKKNGWMKFSMGAYRSWMLAALSDKIKAGASVCWMITTDYQLLPQYGAGKGDSNYANVFPGIKRYLDYPHIASISDPKPMLFFNRHRDKRFPIPSVKKTYQQMTNVWFSQSANDKLVTKLWDLLYFFSKAIQKEILDFFNREL